MKFFGHRQTNKLATEVAVGPVPDTNDSDHANEKQINSTELTSTDTTNDYAQYVEKPAEDAQAGIQKIEAVTLTWTRKELIFAYAW